MRKYLYSLILVCCYLTTHAQWPSNYNSAILVDGHQFNDIIYETLSDNSGGVFVVWKRSLSKDDWTNDIVLSYYNKEGLLQWGKVVFTTTAFSNLPNGTFLDETNIHLIADGYGGVVVTWQDGRNYPNVYISFADIYGQRINKDGQALWTTNGKLLVSGGGNGSVNISYVALKGANDEFYLVRSQLGYCLAGAGCPVTIDKIVAHRFDMNGTSLWTGEKEVYKTDNVEQQFVLDAVYDAVTNSIFITWQDARANTCSNASFGYGCIQNFDLYAQRLDGSSGNKLWLDTGVEVNTSLDNSSFGNDKSLRPQLLIDNSGGLIITWYDYRDNAGAYLYGMRLSKNDGSKIWTPLGKKLSTATLNDESGASYKLTSLADNSPILSFASSAKTIYAQKFNLAGSTLWGSIGKSVSDNSGNNVNPIIVSNDNEPVIVWTKHYSYGNETLYSQKLQQNGSPKWNSVRTINSGFGGWNAKAISDNTGGCIVAWTDYQLGNGNMEVKLSSLSSTGKFKGGLTLALGYGSGAKGQQIEIPLTVKDFTSILTTQFTIEWDNQVASLVSVDGFGLSSITSASFGLTQAANGKVTFSWDDPEANGQSLSEDATLFTLKFNLIGEPGSSTDLSITDSVIPVEVYDRDFEKLGTVKIAGAIYVDSYGFTFDVYYLNGNLAGGGRGGVQDVDLYISGQLVSITDAEGKALVNLLPDESNTINVITPTKNDSDKTGVDAGDLLLIRKHVLGSSVLASTYQMFAADVDHTGTITTLDIAYTRAYILGKQNDFKGKTWTFVNDYEFFTQATKYNIQSTPFTYLDNMAIDFDTQSVDDLLTPDALRFVAVKLGDIDASWAVNENAGGRIEQQSELTITATYPSTPSEETIEIPLTVSNFNDLAAFQFSLTWDKNKLQYQGTDMGSLTLALNEDKVGEGVMSVVWDHNQGKSSSLENGTEVLKLKFKKLEDKGSLQLNSSLTKAIAFDQAIKPVSIKFTEVGGENALINEMQTYPVPFKNELHTEFFLPEQSRVRIALYTTTGKEVYTYEDVFGKGQQKVIINTSNLSPGFYLHKIVAGNEVKVVKVVK
jgi:hypothetical protein